MARLFDTYIMVDWSASSIPKLGADSIWYCVMDACCCPTSSTKCRLSVSSQCKEKNLHLNLKRQKLQKEALAKEQATSKVDRRTGQADQCNQEARFEGLQVEVARVESAQGRDTTRRRRSERLAVLDLEYGPSKRTSSAAASSSLSSDLESTAFDLPGVNKLEEATICAGDTCTPAVQLVENVPTRALAEATLVETLRGLVAHKKRVLLGFDFSLGFSKGFAAALANAQFGICALNGVESISKGEKVPSCLDNENSVAEDTLECSNCDVKQKDTEGSIAVPKEEKLGRLTGGGEKYKEWELVWRYLWEQIIDGDDNGNNRFEVAAKMNKMVSGAPYPFWGCPPSRTSPFLKPKKHPPPTNSVPFPEKREAEMRCTAQPTWKLYTTGSVGSQSLLGIPRVFNIRHHPDLRDCTRVWPFETGLLPPGATTGHSGPAIVIAEVYPSLVPRKCAGGEPKDAGQVRALAMHFAALDAGGRLAPLFSGPRTEGSGDCPMVVRDGGSVPADRRKRKRKGSDEGSTGVTESIPVDVAAIVAEEGWILGVT